MKFFCKKQCSKLNEDWENAIKRQENVLNFLDNCT